MAFNKYFSTVALDIQYSIRYLRKQFFGFLPAANNDTFFISLADCKEISNIISALNNHKTAGPSSIPTNIVKVLNKPISLLSSIVKILERIIYNRLYTFTEKNEFIFCFQFGFR